MHKLSRVIDAPHQWMPAAGRQNPRHGTQDSAAQGIQKFAAIGTAEARASIPAGTSLIVAIVTAGDVMKAAAGRNVAVQRRIDKAHRGAKPLVEEGYQARPQRGYRAGSANHRVNAIDPN